MKISKISISNILGIEELDFSPGVFTTIEGQNGTGKTSVLEAIKAAIKTGHDATLLRNGCQHGEIVLVLDDGTAITKRVTNSSSTTEVQGIDGKKISRPAEAIKALTDILSVNPVEFLTAPKKDRIKVLLEAMPIALDVQELTKLSGIKVTAQEGVHALHVIDLIAKQVYDDRTGTNRAIKEKDGTINQIKLTIPGDIASSCDEDEESIAASIEAARTVKDTEMNRIAEKLQLIGNEEQNKIDAIKTKAEEEIEELKKNIYKIKETAIAAVEEIKADRIAIEAKANLQKEKTIAKFNEAVTPLQSLLMTLRTNRDAVAKRNQSIELVTTMQNELTNLRQDADKQSKALADIDTYKIKLLSSLPIPGLVVRDGEIFRNDIQFDRLNTAQQVDIAVEIAKLRAGKLGIMCVDGLELLDTDSFDAFRQSANKSELQLFVTRVGDSKFEINTQ